jgi:hypothetical protein
VFGVMAIEVPADVTEAWKKRIDAFRESQVSGVSAGESAHGIGEEKF